MSEQIVYLIGQSLGIVAVILGFAAYQMKLVRGILLFEIITAFVFAAHYLLIGAMSGVAMNLLSAVSSIAYYIRNLKESENWVIPIVFISLNIIIGIFTWEAWYSLLIMLGLVASKIGLAFSNAQKTRLCMLIKSPLCLCYNILVLSGGGIIYESALLISALIGIFKYRKSSNSEI